MAATMCRWQPGSPNNTTINKQNGTGFQSTYRAMCKLRGLLRGWASAAHALM